MIRGSGSALMSQHVASGLEAAAAALGGIGPGRARCRAGGGATEQMLVEL